jgi:hypothetical protein
MHQQTRVAYQILGGDEGSAHLDLNLVQHVTVGELGADTTSGDPRPGVPPINILVQLKPEDIKPVRAVAGPGKVSGAKAARGSYAPWAGAPNPQNLFGISRRQSLRHIPSMTGRCRLPASQLPKAQEQDMQAVGAVAASLVTQLRSPAVTQVSIPILREDRLPALFVPAVDRGIPDRVVMFWENGGVGLGTPLLRRRLTDVEKSALEQRASELRNALVPWPESSRDMLLEELSGMLGAWPSMQRLDEETAMCMAAAYLWTVRERPHWAIIKACEMVRAGTAGLNPVYCPSEPEFNIIIGRRVAPYADALRRTQALIDAKVEASAPRKLTREEIEAKLGRPLGEAAPEPAKAPASRVGDGRHAERAMADLAARKAALADVEARRAAARHGGANESKMIHGDSNAAG